MKFDYIALKNSFQCGSICMLIIIYLRAVCF